MLSNLDLTILCFGLLILAALSVYDLVKYILPNILVVLLLFSGICFHFLTGWRFVDPYMAVSGMLMITAFLIIVREIANRLKGADVFGIGDIKLLAAGGFWTGLENIFMTLALGSFIGLIHGLIIFLYAKYKLKKETKLGETRIPAGFGFSIAIAAVVFYEFIYTVY